MSTRPINNRILDSDPGPRGPKPISDPTRKTHPKSSTTTKPTKSQNPLPKKLVDTHLQVKALSRSAIFEPSTLKLGFQGKRVVLGSESNKSLVGVGEKKGVVKKVEERENGVMKKGSVKMVIGKRRSFCDAQMELANFLLNNCAKVVSADMPPFMQIHAVGFARKTKDSLEKFTSKSLALSLKREFDEVYGPAWHCIVGTSFGSFVTHSVGGFLYFALDQKLFILFFKTTVHRAA